MNKTAFFIKKPLLFFSSLIREKLVCVRFGHADKYVYIFDCRPMLDLFDKSKDDNLQKMHKVFLN